MHSKLLTIITALLLSCAAAAAPDATSTATPAAAPAVAAKPDATATTSNGVAPTRSEEFHRLDDDVQNLKQQVLDLNRDLFVLQEDLLFPANTQIAVFVSMDVGTFFNLDSVKLTIDNEPVSSYLYTPREVQALEQGGVQRMYIGNLKVGQHELVAVFTGKGPHERDYRRATTLKFDKGIGAKLVELKISDLQRRLEPEFLVKAWE